MDLHVPQYLFGFTAAAEAILLVAILLLIWYGVARLAPGGRERRISAAILSAGLLGWFALTTYLGQQNFYWAPRNPTVPLILVGVVVPIVIGLALLTHSRRFVRLLDALPVSWLVGVQFYRVLGGIFLVLWLDAEVPWQFALPAGVGDVATGIFAVVVAGMLARKSWRAASAAYAWCLFGIADLVVALSMGALTSPGRIQLLASEAPNSLISAYPLVMIPTFAVPVSVILHGLTIWKLRRMQADAPTNQAIHA